ncbi:MAG TPA: DNA repair protein RecN [Candidatus Pullilachnospira gallistercoris]|uniref:DNA repair protein RecN n=1 Tax=Candidatus Pullilachnospira gallistercoris TaxID=2840911 RepID=A0A9D1EB95_9FIRM|nr:DNA repair protein RecN [Candidatus Pullilachnospira gallistercoris]
MLESLHVKNLALIDETEIVFGKGLNILSGETGAGKSILLGALHLALGGRVAKEMLRDESADAVVEAVFSVRDERQRKLLEEMDLPIYEDEVILSRRITESRTVARINGETVPAAKLKQAGSVLLDIYGQQEHQSLTQKKKHMELLDTYGKMEIEPARERVREAFAAYREKRKELDEADMDDRERARELSFLEHETEEIEAAGLSVGEDETLEREYRRQSNGKKILEAVSGAYQQTGGMDGASDQIGRAIRALSGVEHYDDRLAGFMSMLTDIDGLLNDLNRELFEYQESEAFDARAFAETETRLDEINRLKEKYGNSIEEILAACETKRQRMEQLSSYDSYVAELKAETARLEERLKEACGQLSDVRKKYASRLVRTVEAALRDLNFLDVSFDMQFDQLDHYTSNGTDDGEFMISTNPGEPLKPLRNIASGGEMSRIMLAMKTVLAENDAIDTLIFDEIDSGISGRTAQAVSEKLSVVARDHQVVCITHLPQIAAMADRHFLIEKQVEGGATVSRISLLSREGSIRELARMLGGTEITEKVLENAEEMKNLADNKKRK